MSNEAAAGKNATCHVGKIYTLLTHDIAQEIYRSLEAVEEVYVWMCSQIGSRIDQPWFASASFVLKTDAVLADVKEPARDIIRKRLHDIGTFTSRLVRGEMSVC